VAQDRVQWLTGKDNYETSGFIREEDSVSHMSDYQLLEKYITPQS
jgi:hypothetical protein